MIRELFERKADPQAEVLAEAQALIDDGLELDFVLGLFPDDSAWLEPLLITSASIEEAFEGEPASYYFEASLKSKFLGAAREPRPVVPVVVTPPAYSPMRTAIATMSVTTAAAAIGMLSLGFITAGNAVPGDWNYTFKLANERFEYTLSRGDSRIDIQLQHAQNRVLELKTLSDRGEASPSLFAKVQREFDDLGQLARRQELDPFQKAQFEYVSKNAETVVTSAASKQPELAPNATAVAASIGAAGAAVTELTPTPTPTAAASATATTEPSASASPAATASTTPTPPAPTATPTPGESATPTSSVTSTQLPSEAETATASPSTAP